MVLLDLRWQAASGCAAMSNASVAPGKRSLVALAWLARVGAAPFEPLQLVTGATAPAPTTTSAASSMPGSCAGAR